MRHRLLLVVWLVVFWMAMWRDVSVANLVSGIIVAAGAVALFPPRSADDGLHIRPLALLRFVGSAALAVIRANLYVAWEVVTPTSRINEGVVAVELASQHPAVITFVSHAIILAPGTMVIDIDDGDKTTPTTLYVHVLHLRAVDEVRNEVLHLEQLAMAALASDATVGKEAS